MLIHNICCFRISEMSFCNFFSLCLKDLKVFVPCQNGLPRWIYVRLGQCGNHCVSKQVLSSSQIWAPEQIHVMPRSKLFSSGGHRQNWGRWKLSGELRIGLTLKAELGKFVVWTCKLWKISFIIDVYHWLLHTESLRKERAKWTWFTWTGKAGKGQIYKQSVQSALYSVLLKKIEEFITVCEKAKIL